MSRVIIYLPIKTMLTESLISNLQTISANYDRFLALPILGKLNIDPSTLKVADFIVSKDNQHPLKGTESIFRSNFDLVLPLDLPQTIPINEPEESEYLDVLEYCLALKEYANILKDEKHPINQYNNEIKRLCDLQRHFKIPEIYPIFELICQFVEIYPESAFVSHEPLKPNELPQSVKDRIVSMLRQSFESNPTIRAKGDIFIEVSTDSIDLLNDKGETVGSFVPNMDSLQNVLAFIQWRKNYPYTSPAFYSKDLYLAIMESVYKDLNCFQTIHNLASMLDIDFGSSKNTDVILRSIAKNLM
jgi:hypothetical protein